MPEKNAKCRSCDDKTRNRAEGHRSNSRNKADVIENKDKCHLREPPSPPKLHRGNVPFARCFLGTLSLTLSPQPPWCTVPGCLLTLERSSRRFLHWYIANKGLALGSTHSTLASKIDEGGRERTREGEGRREGARNERTTGDSKELWPVSQESFADRLREQGQTKCS